MSESARLVCFGIGGSTVYCDKCRIQGYDKPDDPRIVGVPDGTPVINKRPAVEHGDGYNLAIRGPMVSVHLAPGTVDRCPEPSETLRRGVSGGFDSMLAMQDIARATKAKYGPLDTVDVGTYIELWRAAGARIGEYRNGHITWEGENDEN
jgi:hypothetical protein